MGHLALARRRTHTQLHHHHHPAERIMRRAPQPDARGAEAGRLAAVARRTARRAAAAQALLAPYLTEGMIAWPVSPRVGNVKNNDPGLVEPINLP